MRISALWPAALFAAAVPLSARVLTTANPAASIEITGECTAEQTSPSDWSIRSADGNAAITFSIRPLAARGGPYADAKTAAATLAADVVEDLGARALEQENRRIGEHECRPLSFVWANEGVDFRNTEVFIEDGGHLFNLTLVAPRDFADIYTPEFLDIVSSLHIGTEGPYTTYTATTLGLQIPVPRNWRKHEKDDRVLWYETARGDDSSLLVQAVPAPTGDESPAVAVTLLLHQGLSKNPEYSELKVHGKSHVNDLDLYILSARRTAGKVPGKEVFIQIDRGQTVAAINLTLSAGHEDHWSDYVAQLITGITPLAAAPDDARAATIIGTVRDARGLVASAVRVTLTLVTRFDPLEGAVVAQTSTDDRGGYSFTADPRFAYLVHAGDGPEAFNAGSGAAGRRFVDLAREDTPPVLDITLHRQR